MARDPRFVEQLMATVAVPDAARALAGKGTGSLSRTEVSQLGAMLIQGAFPDQVTNLVAPERNLLGYISSVVMPRMRPSEIGEAAKAVEVDSMATNRKRKS